MIHLPIDDFLPQIKDSLRACPNLVLTAEPGAGKTTRLPAALLDLTPKKIIVLEPRRMAAVAAASRVCEEQGFTLGKEVGYQVRFDNRTQPETRLIFMTEALLARRMTQDPELQDIGAIVLDEFHERSLHVDLSLGLLKELQDLGSDIKIVVMSATLDADNISAYLGKCPIVAVPGKLFPLEIIYQKNSQLLRTLPQFYENLETTLRSALLQTQNDILMFLPGVGEIEKFARDLEGKFPQLAIVPLHGSLRLEEQRRALIRGSQQKIILSTNIAESSVTVDGVDTVIDSGLEKNIRYDLKSNFSKLELSRISISSATQRSGRAARQFPGKCYRLWNKQDELSFPKDTLAEIHRSDLSESLLFLASQGITQFESFQWYEKPHKIALQNAELFLKSTHLLDREGRLTTLGQKVLLYPTSIRAALVALEGERLGCRELGVAFAALLQERDLVAKNHIFQLSSADPQSDLLPRLEIVSLALQGKVSGHAHRATVNNIIQSYHQISQLSPQNRNNPSWSFTSVTALKNDLDKLLAQTFLDRLCRRRGTSDRALMMGGRGVKLATESVVKSEEFFFAISGISTQDADSTISIASAVSKEFLLKHFESEIQKVRHLTFSEEKGQYFIQEYKMLRDLPLDEPTLKPASTEEIADKIADLCCDNFSALIKDNEELAKWLLRLQYASSKIEQPVELEALKQKALASASYGCRSLKEVASKDLVYFFEQELSLQLRDILHKEFPAKIKVPSGSLIPVIYSLEKDPYMEVRIQEVFGWQTTPAINFGKTTLTIHLLGPNFRPVQVTANLESFWKNAYTEVRKELRIKYPKHQWPENPADGIAEAKGRRRS